MQIFIVGSIFETIQALDKKRFWKQILETRQILNAIKGISTGWKNHPIVDMYREYIKWLELYLLAFEAYRIGDLEKAIILSDEAEKFKPMFLNCVEYIENMKRRLYTQDKEYYSQWASLGESKTNYYYINGTWKEYVQQK